MPCQLFHGPTAKAQALEHAGELLLEAPYGDEGLSVAEARAIVQRMLWPPVGLGKGYLLIGPVDLARQKSLDVLLKNLEEHNPESVVPLLWAHDVEGVPPTILSRCIPVWAPGTVNFGELEEIAGKVLFAIEDGEFPALVKALEEAKGKESDLVLAMAQTATQIGSSWFILQALRELVSTKEPKPLELLAAFSSLESFYVRR